MKKYATTKEQCQNSINTRNGNLCTQCGSVLEPIETVDNSNNPTFWAGCMKCSKIDAGTTKEVFEISKWLVEERNYVAYSFMHREKQENIDYWRKCQIGGTASFVRDILNKQKELELSSV